LSTIANFELERSQKKSKRKI